MQGDLKLQLRVGAQHQLSPLTNIAYDKMRESGLKHGDVVSVTIHGEKRSLSANNLFHKWCEVAGEYFGVPGKNKEERKENMKNVFKHQFLGYEDIVVGKLTIKEQLRETSKLSKGEMCHLMECVAGWCMSKGCALPMPEDNEYAKWQAEQVA